MTERILNDRYALEAKVGEGGMAVTYRARDLLLNRTVAVKLMREQFTSDQQFVERFRREAQAAARLSHENIAGVYDTGRANGTYYIVMEYVEGTDLKQRLRREGALPLTTALDLGRQIASALDAAHRSGLVHRDIKPHNILISTDGKVKVTDFGIAKLTSEGEDTGVIIGSVHYISPEQARGEATTPSSDLYSFGAVMFEMLTGRTVFEAENAMAVAHKQIYDRPQLPRTLRPDIPPAVESMVMRCLEKDPRARYQSAAELQAVLTQLINQLTQEETIVITPVEPSMDATMVFSAPPTTPRPHDPFRTPPPAYEEPERRGNPWLIALVLILLAVGGGFGAYKMLSPSTPADHTHNGQPTTNVSVPNVVGMSKDDALARLQTIGLHGEIKMAYDDTTPEGEVFKQNPSMLSDVAEGTTVMVWVSDGPATLLLPDVAESTMDQAKTVIRSAGFKGDFLISSEESATLPKGQVIRTDPPANTTVKRKGKITLIVSKGQTPPIEERFQSTAPNIGESTTYVRVEFERPKGSEPQRMWEGTLQPGEKIPVQVFERNEDEVVLVRMLAGKDANSRLDIQEENEYGPGPTPTATN